MKLIIDIDDEEYNRFKKAEIKGYVSTQIPISMIMNGVPLDSISTISVGVDGKAVQIYPNNEVLDKIRDEIKDRLYINSPIFRELIDYRNGKITTDDVIEKFNRVTRQEVLQIIDKYTKEDKE